MPDPILGEIRLTSFNFAPTGWGLCDGRLYQIKDYPALYSIIGTTYGGDGKETFAVPDLRGRVPMHVSARSEGQDQPSYGTLGDKNGLEEVVLTDDQLPRHTHAFMAWGGGNGSARNPDNAAFATAAVHNAYAEPGAGTLQPLDSRSIVPNSGGMAHDNMQPYTTINFIISLDGAYPQRAPGEIGLFREVVNGGDTTAYAEKVNDSVLKRFYLINAYDGPIQVEAPSMSEWVGAIGNAISGEKILQPGEVSEISFQCIPTKIGGFSFDVALTAKRINFSKEPPVLFEPSIVHNFSVEGTIGQSTIGLTTSEGAPVYNNGKDWQGFEVQADTPQKIGYIIKNTAGAGGGVLTVEPPEFLNQAKMTAVSSSLTASQNILPDQSLNFIVTYTASSTPDDGKPFNFDVSIGNNSSNLSPFVFTVYGTASLSTMSPQDSENAKPSAAKPHVTEADPDGVVPRLILLEYILDGATYTQRPCLAGHARTIEISVMPPGSMGASISDPSSPSDTQANVTSVVLSQVGQYDLGPEERTTFSITYTPEASGPYSFDVNITTSSQLVPNYGIVIAGEAYEAAPVMELFSVDGSTAILNGGLDLIPDQVTVGQAVSRSYVIRNTGNAPLNFESFQAINGANATGKVLTSSSTLAVGATFNLVVQLTPTTDLPPNAVFTDFFSVDFVITTNDASTSPYLFTVGGTEKSA